MNNVLWLAAIAIFVAAFVWVVARRQANPGRPAVPVRFTRHARERMTLRGVAEQEILSAITSPGRFSRDRIENSVRLEADYGDRVLKVWVAEPWPSSAAIVVKSAAWHYRTSFTIAPGSVGRLIGAKGRTVKALRQETGAHISIDGPKVTITAGDRPKLEHAIQRVTDLAVQGG